MKWSWGLGCLAAKDVFIDFRIQFLQFCPGIAVLSLSWMSSD